MKLPFVKIVPNGKSFDITGYFGDVWNTLEEVLQFKTLFKHEKVLDERKSLNGSTQELILNPVVFKESDVDNFQHTMPLATIWYEIFFKKDINKVSSIFYILIWKGELWLAFFLTIFLLALSLWIINLTEYYRRCRYNSIEFEEELMMISNEQDEEDEEIDTSIISCFLTVLASILNQGEQIRSNNISLRIIYLVSILFGLVMVTSFSAVLISKLATLKPSIDFTSLEEVAEKQSHVLCVSETSVAYNYFKEDSKDTIQKKWVPLLNRPPCTVGKGEVVPTRDYCADNTLVVETLHNANYMWNNNPSDCHVINIKQRLYFSYVSILTKKQFPYTKILTKYLLKMHTAGIIMKLQQQWLPSQANPRAKTRSDYELKITFNHIKTLLFTYISVIGLSLIILCLEIIFSKYHR